MTRISRKSIETSVENQIAIASIISTTYLQRIDPIINYDFFINPFIKTICRWCLDYYRLYEKAPGLNIKPIFDVERHKLDPAEAELISTILSKLNEDYINGNGINDDYVYDNTLKHFSKRDLDLRLEQASRLKDLDRVDEARDLLTQKSNVERALINCVNPFDEDVIFDTFHHKGREVVTMPGALGEILGPLERGWLLGILGGYKIGKSYSMEEIAIRGLVQRKRIAYFNFEMNLYSMNQRIYRRLSGLGNEGVTLYPIFDCLSNQTGVCDKSERKSKVSVKKKASDKPSFNMEYVPCDVCRGISRDFIPDVWYESVTAPIYEYRTVKKKMRDFKEMYSDSFRLWCYPRFSASIDDMLRDLDYVERFDNFIPDIIVADYANIMKPAKGDRQEGYQAIDDIWKRLAGLAGERHCLVITGSQGTEVH